MKHILILTMLFPILAFGTVPGTAVKTAELDADGATVAFPFSFAYSATSEIKVDVITDAGDVATRQTETSDYSVSPSSSTSAGTVTFNTAPADGNYVVISRTTSNTQQSDIDAGAYTDRTAIESMSDKLTRITQELADAITGSIRVPQGEVGTDMVLPGALARASAYVFFDPTGVLSLASSVVLSGATVTPYMETVLDDTTAAIAQATLLLKDGSADLVLGTVQTKLSPTINVQAYDATGDGTTDDTVAMQAALDAALAAAGTSGTAAVYVPAGEYKLVTSALTWSPANSAVELYMYGDGRGTQIIQTTANVNCFTVGNATYGCKVHIRDIGFGCVAGTGTALELTKMTRSLMDNVHIPGAGAYGIHVKTGWINTLSNITCSTQGTPNPTNTVGAPTAAWIYLDANTSLVNDFRFYGLMIENGGTINTTGLQIDDDGKNISVFGGTIEGIGAPFVIEGIKDIILDNVYTESATSPSTLTSCKAGRVEINGNVEWTFDDCDSIWIYGRSTWSSDAELVTINSNCRAMRIQDYQINGGRFENLRNHAADTDVRFIIDGTDQLAADEGEAGPGVMTRNYPILAGGTNRWKDATTLSAPWLSIGSPTIAREATITWANHDFSIKVTAADKDKGIRYAIPEYLHDQWVTMEAWVFITSGEVELTVATTYRILNKVTETGTWVKLSASVFPVGDKDDLHIVSADAAAVFYIGAVNIWAESGPERAIPAITATDATPSVSGTNLLLSAGTTTITDFDDGYEGQIFTFIAETSITITDGTNIFLNGSGNFAMTATDTLTLICKADNKWYEMGRGDNGA